MIEMLPLWALLLKKSPGGDGVEKGQNGEGWKYLAD